jgi:hypothetical protein
MDKQEIAIELYISLITFKELNKKERRMWLDIVQDYGPENIIDYIQIYTEEGRKSLNLIFKKTTEGWEYTIPLSRNLGADEAEKIVAAWDAYYSEDFEIEASTPSNGKAAPDYDFEEEDEHSDEYEMFAESLSKLQHQTRINKMTKEGWRYGVTLSYKNRTDPSLLPWEQLPESKKEIDYNYAAQVIELLENMGYNIEEKGE